MREITLIINVTGMGFNPSSSHRLVEVRCAELLNRVPSGQIFHAYCNPGRDVPAKDFAVYSLTEDFLKDKPPFSEAAGDLITFLGDAPLIITDYASDFALGVLNAELERVGRPQIARERLVDKEDSFFGACPICHKVDGYANAGRSHRYYCKEHKKSWLVGSNIFSDWREQTKEEQRKIWDEIGLDDFEDVTPYFDDTPDFWEVCKDRCPAIYERYESVLTRARAENAEPPF